MQLSDAAQPSIFALTGAAFGYGDRAVLADVDWHVQPGDLVAVLGPNGSGKSTLVRGVLGLCQHVGGRVDVFGVPVEHFRERSRIGYVPQRHTLSTSVRATAAEVVGVGRTVVRRWPRRAGASDRRIVAEALQTVRLADRADADVATLSGGQQRRVLIARALAARPDVLVMDEPTAGVDAASQHVLADVLEALRSAGTTMVVVTHELGIFAHLVDRVTVVDHGGIAFDGTRAQFEADPAVLHDHHSHHHDDEPDPQRPGAVVPGLVPGLLPPRSTP